MKQIKQQQVLFIASLLAAVSMLNFACTSNNTPQFGTPQITLEGNGSADLAPGQTATVSLKLKADGAAKSVIVKKNGGFLKEVPVLATSDKFDFQTEAFSKTALEGEEITYSFILTNTGKVESQEVTFVLRAALYPTRQLGTTAVFDLGGVGKEGKLETGTLKLSKNRRYYLPASLEIGEAAELIIEEGVELYMNADASEKIELEVDGKVNITGSSNAPVVMTSSKILSNPQQAQVNDWEKFKVEGKGKNTSSGRISYLRIEYPGHRAFTLSDVGSGTQVDHIQVYKSGKNASEDGMGIMIAEESDVNVKYLVATDCEGGSFQLKNNYSGKMQFLISVSSAFHKKNDAFRFEQSVSPVVANVTILGPGSNTEKDTQGIYMKDAAAAKIYNSIVAGFSRRAVRAKDEVKITDLNGKAVFAHSYVFDIKEDAFKDLATAFAGNFDASGQRTGNPFFNNVLKKTGDQFDCESIDGIGVNDFIPNAEKTSTFNPKSLDTFFSEAPFVGAIKNETDDWTKGWVKNPDGTIR